MSNLKGRTLFVSGASRGIGLEIAKRAAKDGANIILAAKTAEAHPKLPGTIYTAADEIIKSNQLEACDQCGDCPINSTTDYSTTSANTPFLYKNCIDKSQPYGYNDSDLKNLYLSRNELQCRMVAPILSQDQYLQQNYPNPN